MNEQDQRGVDPFHHSLLQLLHNNNNVRTIVEMCFNDNQSIEDCVCDVQANLKLKRPCQSQRRKCAHENCFLFVVTKLPLKPDIEPDLYCRFHKSLGRKCQRRMRSLASVQDSSDDGSDSDVVEIEPPMKLAQISPATQAATVGFHVDEDDLIQYDEDGFEVDSPFVDYTNCFSSYKRPPECEVCFYESLRLKVIPTCGHWLCESCLEKIDDKVCPFCRSEYVFDDYYEEHLKCCRLQRYEQKVFALLVQKLTQRPKKRRRNESANNDDIWVDGIYWNRRELHA